MHYSNQSIPLSLGKSNNLIPVSIHSDNLIPSTVNTTKISGQFILIKVTKWTRDLNLKTELSDWLIYQSMFRLMVVENCFCHRSTLKIINSKVIFGIYKPLKLQVGSFDMCRFVYPVLFSSLLKKKDERRRNYCTRKRECKYWFHTVYIRACCYFIYLLLWSSIFNLSAVVLIFIFPIFRLNSGNS